MGYLSFSEKTFTLGTVRWEVLFILARVKKRNNTNVGKMIKGRVSVGIAWQILRYLTLIVALAGYVTCTKEVFNTFCHLPLALDMRSNIAFISVVRPNLVQIKK